MKSQVYLIYFVSVKIVDTSVIYSQRSLVKVLIPIKYQGEREGGIYIYVSM